MHSWLPRSPELPITLSVSLYISGLHQLAEQWPPARITGLSYCEQDPGFHDTLQGAWSTPTYPANQDEAGTYHHDLAGRVLLSVDTGPRVRIRLQLSYDATGFIAASLLNAQHSPNTLTVTNDVLGAYWCTASGLQNYLGFGRLCSQYAPTSDSFDDPSP